MYKTNSIMKDLIPYFLKKLLKNVKYKILFDRKKAINKFKIIYELPNIV